MKFSQSAARAWVAVVSIILICGCGDTFRPVATPLPQPSPDPQNPRLAVFTSCVFVGGSCSSAGNVGAATDVNVSGDTLVGVTPVGRSPVFALVEAVRVSTADRDNDTVSTYSHLNLGTTTTISAATTTGLPSGARPSSLVDANGTIYVAESGRNVVGVLGSSPVALSTEIPVGANPVNLTVLPNAKKVYAVNQGDNSVTVISAVDNSVLATVAVGTSPIWAVPSADSTRVYVVNQGSGTVSVIDATSDAAVSTIPVGSSPNYAIFDAKNQRVLITNSGSNSITAINADPTSPNFLLNSKTIAVGTNPVSVTALADGSRVYVANAGSNSVSVINSLSLAVTKTIPVGTAPVWISSDAESAKVLTANRDSFDVSVINTATDSETLDTAGNPSRLKAPQIDATCVPTTPTTCPRLNPVFIAVGPG